MPYDYHKQCLTCNLDSRLRDMVDGWGGTYAALSRELFSTHNIAISSDALSNHKRFHSNQQQVNVSDDKEETEDGVVEVNGVKYFKRLKKQWQLHTGEWRRTYDYVPVENTEPTLDFNSLSEHLRNASKPKVDFEPMIKKSRTVVTQFADLQAGKVGSRGDSNDLVNRVSEFKSKMVDYIKDSNADNAVFVDNGDVVEGFENTEQQAFTNDISLMDQIELATLLEFDLILTQMQNVKHVDVAGVPSNHGAWRKGKGYLGTPADDWGLFILRQIERTVKFSPEYQDRATFHFPEKWEKTLTLDVGSEILGMAHGDDCSQDKTPEWWAKQVHGGSPLADATMLLTGHYHNFRLQNSGRRADGRMKWWLSGNSMDNGSDWWKHKAGHDSSPGVTMFIIDEDTGFDVKSLEIL